MHDQDTSKVDGWVIDYGVSGTVNEAEFREYLLTLGLRTYDGVDKLAFARLRFEALEHGWIEDSGVNINILTTETKIPLAINIFPNPFSAITTLTFVGNEYPTKVAVYDIKGKLVKRFSKTNSKSVTWNTSKLAVGMYVLNVDYKKSKLTKKLLVVR